MNPKALSLLVAAVLTASVSHAQDARNFFKSAFDQFKAKNYRAAEDLFSTGLALDDKDAQAWRYYGESLQVNKSNMKARSAYKRAIALMPNNPERTILEAKVKTLKPSIVPGVECRVLIEKVDPVVLQGMADKLIDIPEALGSKVIIKLDEYPDAYSTTTTTPCGEIYLYKTRNHKTLISKQVHMLGYPQVSLADDSGEIEMVLKAFTGSPIDVQAGPQSWTYSKLIKAYGKVREVPASCRTTNVEGAESVIESTCQVSENKPSGSRSKYIKQFDILIEQPTASNRIEVVSIEATK